MTDPNLHPMPQSKRDVSELGKVEEKPKGSNKWRMHVQLYDCGKNINVYGPLRLGRNAKAQAEEDLRRARESESRDAMIAPS